MGSLWNYGGLWGFVHGTQYPAPPGHNSSSEGGLYHKGPSVGSAGYDAGVINKKTTKKTTKKTARTTTNSEDVTMTDEYTYRTVDRIKVYYPSDWVWGQGDYNRIVVSPVLGADHAKFLIGGKWFHVPKGTIEDTYNGSPCFVRPATSTVMDRITFGSGVNKDIWVVVFMIILIILCIGMLDRGR